MNCVWPVWQTVTVHNAYLLHCVSYIASPPNVSITHQRDFPMTHKHTVHVIRSGELWNAANHHKLKFGCRRKLVFISAWQLDPARWKKDKTQKKKNTWPLSLSLSLSIYLSLSLSHTRTHTHTHTHTRARRFQVTKRYIWISKQMLQRTQKLWIWRLVAQ